ncbi:hypothetical protein C6P45_002817 [Maudiozyma exigua]|uniref:Uncharacterized protein n=1 Tax=Maudiozyma exigua TaxID=34358 RepID=A0A9P7B2J2_MAUEX|nr:hypothetical protein C6P45_002817 [Kazachstania exigua]
MENSVRNSFVDSIQEHILEYMDTADNFLQLDSLVDKELHDFKDELKSLLKQRITKIKYSTEEGTSGHRLHHPYAQNLLRTPERPDPKYSKYLDDLKHYDTNEISTPIKQMTYKESPEKRTSFDSPGDEITVLYSHMNPVTPLSKLLSPIEVTHAINISRLDDATSLSTTDESSLIEGNDFDDEIYTFYYESDISLDSNDSVKNNNKVWSIANN